MKKIYALASIYTIFTCSSLTARVWTPPLPFYVPYVLLPMLDDHDHWWHVTGQATAFSRHAKKAFIKKSTGQPADVTGENNLAALLFNQPTFMPQQAFFDSTASTPTNPFLNTTFAPAISYRNTGVIIEFDFYATTEHDWNIGLRTRIPFHSFRVKHHYSPAGSGTSPMNGAQAADVAQTQTLSVGGTQLETFAFRLDFLAQLPASCSSVGLQNQFVVFSNTSGGFGGKITMDGIDITNASPNILNRNPVTAVYRTDPKLAPGQFYLPLTQAQALPALSADGAAANNTPLQNNQGTLFSATTIYTPLGNSTNNQEHLWIIPSINFAVPNLVVNARSIRDDVLAMLGSCVNSSAEELFESGGLSFANQTRGGAGDWFFEGFLGHYFASWVYGEVNLIAVAPTGRKYDPEKIFQQQLGNNGHGEIGLGARVYLLAHDCVRFFGDVNYNWILHRHEKVLATFQGATIKNLGPETTASISWRSVVGHAAAQGVYTWNDRYAFEGTWSYEGYHKTKDHVSFATAELTDFLGNTQPLDATVIEQRTNVTTHTLALQATLLFSADWTDVRWYGGASWVVGGHNTPRDRGWQIGIQMHV
ncbi:MAG TPA: hypothetical protein VEK38_01640 [Candidatus Bathyarchaeia archaeon]|nr:hypothetical protein [Candidatus Bathyarchaeia archaeon]